MEHERSVDPSVKGCLLSEGESRVETTAEKCPSRRRLPWCYKVLRTLMAVGLLERLLTSTVLGLKVNTVWLGSKCQLSMHLHFREAVMRW